MQYGEFFRISASALATLSRRAVMASLMATTRLFDPHVYWPGVSRKLKKNFTDFGGTAHHGFCKAGHLKRPMLRGLGGMG
jgi:hypothetical protein